MTQFEQDKVAAETAAQYDQNLVLYRAWIKKHPEVADCTANEKAFQEYLDWEDSFVESDLDFALGNLRSRLSLAIQRIPTAEETKQSLIAKILERLQSTNNKHWQVPHNVQTEQTKMQFWNLEQLTARLNDVVRAQELSTKPVNELKVIVESARKYVGYPQLGKTVVPPGTIHAVPLNADYLKSLDPWDLKRLCRLYGVEQVNSRLAGKE
jgi:G:T/U-mismatch repair DNA glycosylase